MRVGWRLVALSGDGDDADDASTWQNRLKVGKKVGIKGGCLKKGRLILMGFSWVGGKVF